MTKTATQAIADGKDTTAIPEKSQKCMQATVSKMGFDIMKVLRIRT